MERRLAIALPLTAALLLGSCAGEPPPAGAPPAPGPAFDLASLAGSPAEFGPRVRGVVEGAFEAARAASSRR